MESAKQGRVTRGARRARAKEEERGGGQWSAGVGEDWSESGGVGEKERRGKWRGRLQREWKRSGSKTEHIGNEDEGNGAVRKRSGRKLSRGAKRHHGLLLKLREAGEIQEL